MRIGNEELAISNQKQTQRQQHSQRGVYTSVSIRQLPTDRMERAASFSASVEDFGTSGNHEISNEELAR